MPKDKKELGSKNDSIVIVDPYKRYNDHHGYYPTDISEMDGDGLNFDFLIGSKHPPKNGSSYTKRHK
jgi:hypothetical protein